MTFFQQLKALGTTTKYSFIAYMRDPSAAFFGFAFPIIFIDIFGLIGQGGSSFDVAIRPNTPTDSPVYQALDELEAINLITDKTSAEIDEDLNRGDLPAAISIEEVQPEGSQTQFQFKLETSGADPENAGAVVSIISNVVNSINNPPSQEESQLVQLNVQEVEGRRYTPTDFILPGQLSFALLSTAVFGVAFTLIGLRKTLVLKRMFATPAPKWVILGGKILGTMIVSVIQALTIIAVGFFFFDFTLVNGWITLLEMLLLSVFGLLVFLGFGLLVASLAKTEEGASPIANIITLPQFILSGAFFPTDLFPDFLQPFANALPMTFLNEAMRTVSFEGGGLIAVWQPMVWLGVWAFVVYALTIPLFKWE
jgi:ABC-2 type transport system permease protein